MTFSSSGQRGFCLPHTPMRFQQSLISPSLGDFLTALASAILISSLGVVHRRHLVASLLRQHARGTRAIDCGRGDIPCVLGLLRVVLLGLFVLGFVFVCLAVLLRGLGVFALGLAYQSHEVIAIGGRAVFAQ